MGPSNQRTYLAEHEYLHPETKAVIRKDKLGIEKSLPLTTPKIRKDPELQVKISMLGMSDRPEKLDGVPRCGKGIETHFSYRL
jgi:hypothetical protein